MYTNGIQYLKNTHYKVLIINIQMKNKQREDSSIDPFKNIFHLIGIEPATYHTLTL